MDAVLTLVHRLVRQPDGQDLIEYGVLVALIALVSLLVVTAVGTTIKSVFWDTFTSVIASAV